LLLVTCTQVRLPGGNLEVLFSDTVGFIQKLVTQLVAAFRAALTCFLFT
jgi:GTP-binding protein HflX